MEDEGSEPGFRASGPPPQSFGVSMSMAGDRWGWGMPVLGTGRREAQQGARGLATDPKGRMGTRPGFKVEYTLACGLLESTQGDRDSYTPIFQMRKWRLRDQKWLV